MNRLQRRRLSEALLSYKERTGRSWNHVAGDIYEWTNADFTEVQLSKLAGGVPHRDLKLRERGIREYPLPVGGEAVVRFLTDPLSPGKSLLREELLAAVHPPAPHSLVAFFAQSGLVDLKAMEAISGAFEADFVAPVGKQRWDLTLESTSYAGLLSCALGMYAEGSCAAAQSAGWAVLSPEGHLLMVFHHRMRPENELLTAQAASPPLLGDQPVDALELALMSPCRDMRDRNEAPTSSPLLTLAFQRTRKKIVATATKAG